MGCYQFDKAIALFRDFVAVGGLGLSGCSHWATKITLSLQRVG